MQETVDHIKNELLPDYDFDAHNHDDYDDEYRPREQNDNAVNNIEKSFDINQIPTTNVSDDVEKWD